MHPLADAESTPGLSLTDSRARPATASLLRLALDSIDYGVLLLDADRQLELANNPARAALKRRFPFELVGQRLNGCSMQANAGLNRLLRAAERSERHLEVFEFNGQKTCVAAMPVTAGANDGGGKGGTLLTLGRRTACSELTLRMFSRTMQLTAAESRVLDSLVTGLSPAQIASEQNVKESTVRTHIRSLLAKVGASGLRDLASQMAVLPPVQTTAF
jgi:DNA-binding CsgD family transcriptional regulator